MINLTKETRRVIQVMILLTLIALTVAWFYYRDKNRSEDPRVVEAKYKIQRFQLVSDTEDYVHALSILDSIQVLYNTFEHYRNSYEVGVIYNNKSAIYLTLALHHNTDSLGKLKNFEFAEKYAKLSISIYENWLNKFENLTEDKIGIEIQNNFTDGLVASEKRITKIFKKRIKEIQDAQYETQRRLSVSYTNLGIVNRHNNQVEAAAECYQKALELWVRNLSARNNLNIILDKPLEKLNFIDKMFPPEKEE